MRDWTRFLPHRIRKYPDSPVHALWDSLQIYLLPLWRADLFFSGFAVELTGYGWTVAVSGKKKPLFLLGLPPSFLDTRTEEEELKKKRETARSLRNP